MNGGQKHIDVPGMGVVSFPDSMSDDAIGAAIKRSLTDSTQVPKDTSPPFLQSMLSGVTEPGRRVEEAAQTMKKDFPLGVAQAGRAGLQAGTELTGIPSAIRAVKQAGSVGEFVGGGLEGVMNTVPWILNKGSQAIEGGLRKVGVPESVLNMGMSPEASQEVGKLLTEAGSVALAPAIEKGLGATIPPFAEKVGTALSERSLNKSAAEIKRVAPPTGKELHYDEAMQRAQPYMAEQTKQTPIDKKSDLSPIRQAANIVHDAKERLWTDKVMPQIDRHPEIMIDGTKVSSAIKGNVSNYLQDLEPRTAEAMKSYSSLFEKEIPIQKAQEYLSGLNADLSKYYKMTPGEQAAVDQTSGGIASKQIASEALRDEIYDKLQQAGETNVPELRKDYGALKQIHTALERNIVRTEKAQPPWYQMGWRHSGSPIGAAFVGEITAHALGADPVTTAVTAAGAGASLAFARHRMLPQPTITRAFGRLEGADIAPKGSLPPIPDIVTKARAEAESGAKVTLAQRNLIRQYYPDEADEIIAKAAPTRSQRRK